LLPNNRRGRRNSTAGTSGPGKLSGTRSTGLK
jgi:hypothetical protein